MNDIRMLEREADDAVELWDMAEDEGDTGALAEVEANVRAALGKAKDAELKALLSGEVDANDCYIEINAGAGGTESQDWASMLRRMYVRYANAKGWKIEEIDDWHQVGDHADQGRVRLWLAEERERRASSRADLAL